MSADGGVSGVDAVRFYLLDEDRCRRYGAPTPELRPAAPYRAWAVDWGYAPLALAIEYEGGEGKESGKSRHRTRQGYADDCIKYTALAMLGWLVVRLTVEMVADGSAWLLIDAALELRRTELLHRRADITGPMAALLKALPKQRNVSRMRKRAAAQQGKTRQGQGNKASA